MNAVLSRIQFLDESLIPIGVWVESRRLCDGIDLKDTPFVALTLHLNGDLWTEDDELKRGLTNRGFLKFFNQPK